MYMWRSRALISLSLYQNTHSNDKSGISKVSMLPRMLRECLSSSSEDIDGVTGFGLSFETMHGSTGSCI